MNPYQVRSTEGLSGIELTVALYDGILRFLYRAIDAVEAGDERRRRTEVKRALDIVIHLQATLRMDIGGEPAKALSEFYASTFAQILQASQSASKPKFEHAIHCVKNVRDAWRQAATSPEVNRISPQDASLAQGPIRGGFTGGEYRNDAAAGSRWNA